MMRSLSTSAFGQPSGTKLTLGARGVCGEGCRFSMAEGYPSGSPGASRHSLLGGVHIKRSARGHRLRITSLNILDFSLYRRCCSRPSFRPRMYRRKRGRGQRGPAERNLRRVFICRVAGSALRAAAPVRARVNKVAPNFPRKRENKPFRYLHTAANEPRRWVARLNRNAAALAARGGNDVDLEILPGGRGSAYAWPDRAQCPPPA